MIKFLSKKKRREYEEMIIKEILDDLKKKHQKSNKTKKLEEISSLKQRLFELEECHE